MEIAPMNKTNIIEFIIDHLLFKLWNVSSKMRKRLRWMVKERIAVVPAYNEKLLLVFKWMRIEDNDSDNYIKPSEEMRKGLVNYILFFLEDIPAVLKVNDEVNCYKISASVNTSKKINYLHKLDIFDRNLDYHPNLQINKVKELHIFSLSSQEIQFSLHNINFIYDLRVFDCKIKSLDLSKIRIFRMSFSLTDFQGTVKLSDCLHHLTLDYCSNIENIKCSKLQKLSIAFHYVYKKTMDYKWFSHMNSLKELRTEKINLKMLNSLPSSIRSMHSEKISNFKNQQNMNSLREKFRYLKETNWKMKLKDIEFLSLRGVTPIPDKTKNSARPKKIRIMQGYGELLKSCNELFEQVRDVVVKCDDFRFDCLPAGIRYLTVNGYYFDSELIDSIRLNRNKFKETVLIVEEYGLSRLEAILDCFKEIAVITNYYSNIQRSKNIYSHLKIREHKLL